MRGIKKRMKAELSESNVKLIEQYDMEMVRNLRGLYAGNWNAFRS